VSGRWQWTFVIQLVPLLSHAAYTGPEACRPCHPAEYATQSKSRHDNALHPSAETPLPSLLAGAPIRERSGIVFNYKTDPNGLLAILSNGREQIEARLQWTFGSGAQAYTPVGVRNGSYFEHRVSFYTSVAHPGRTLGHPGEASRSLDSALGLVQNPDTIYRCFNCHATGVKPGPDLSAMRAGVTCERCHGPGSAHIKAVQSRRPRAEILASIIAPSLHTARESVLFCAQCHRSPSLTASSKAPEVEDPLSIRFQPVGLMASNCFLKSGTLACTTCHNPHRDASRDAGFYAAKCLDCHAADTKTRSTNCGISKRENCIPCHMQRRSPAEFLTFTDHRIRVYR
jgi:hypothetical protein